MGSKGGSKPQTSTSTNYTSSLPQYAKPYYERLMSRAEAETNQPYTAYPGQRIQGFTGDQAGAFQGIRNLNLTGNPTVDNAAQMAGASGIQAMMAGNYTPLYAQTQQWGPEAAQRYMDPYLSNVLDRLQARTTERYNEQAGARGTAAERANAYGGSRQGIQDFLAQRELNQQLGDTEAQQYSQAYNNAQGVFGSDMSRGLAAQQGNQQADLGAAQLGLAGAQAGTQAASVLGQLGGQQQAMTMERLNALAQVGKQQQDLGQQGLDTANTDFINQRDYERQNLAFMSGIMHGVPVAANSETVNTAPGPNQFSQLAGLGIAGAQLGKMAG